MLFALWHRGYDGKGRGDMEVRSGSEKSIRLLVALANILLGLTLLVAFGWTTLRIYHAVLIFTLGILLAYALDPMVTGLRRLSRDRISRGAGVFLVLIGFLVLIAVVVTAAAGPTGRQLHELEERAPELRARADRLAGSADQWLTQRHIPFRVANGAQRLLALAHQRSQALVSEALHAAGLVALGLVDSLLVLLVAIYLLIYSPELKQRLSKHVPPLYQEHFHG